MASLFSVPSAVIGLMGRRPQQQNPMLALAGGSPLQGAYAAAEQVLAQPAPMQQGVAQRERVNPLNVLFRGLAPNISGALDTERARLQMEADRPQAMATAQENERIARALGPQALLAFRSSPEKFGESLGYQYRPQVVANGAIQSTPGLGQVLENRDEMAWGDSLVSVGQDGVQTLATRGPTIAEQNDAERNRIAGIGAGQNTVGRFRLDAQGNPIFEAPQEYTLGENQTRFENGTQVARGTTPAADNSKADMAADNAIAAAQNTRNAVQRAREQTGRLSAGVLSGLIPANQSRADLAATIETIQGNLSFAELSRMRAASPTGGALGSIAVKELELLGATVASLNQNQSPDEFRRSLDVIDDAMRRWEEAVNADRSQRGQGQQTQQQGSQPSREALLAEARRRGLIR